MKKVMILIISVILLASFFVVAENGSDNSGNSDDDSRESNTEDDEDLLEAELEIEIESDDSTSSETNLATTGIVEFVDVEGGCWRINGDDGTNYEATNLDSSFKRDGLKIRFEGEFREDMASTCQVGKLITLTRIEIEDDSTSSETEIKDGRLESRTKEKTEIKYANGTKIKYEYELRERGNLTEEQKQRIMEVKNRLQLARENGTCPQQCECSGSTIKCRLENGTREMIIHAGNSNNTIIQIKNTNASTQVTLYKSDDGKIYGVFKDNKTREIILPDEIREKIQNRTRAHFENETYNLTEDGNYEIEARKRAKLIWTIPVKERVEVRIDAETGEIIRTKTSWWGFLAKDVEAENETETQ